MALFVAHHNPYYNRYAEQSGYGIDWQGEEFRNYIAHNEYRRAGEHRARNKNAVVAVAEQHACYVGHGKADKSYRAAEGRDRAREEGSGAPL